MATSTPAKIINIQYEGKVIKKRLTMCEKDSTDPLFDVAISPLKMIVTRLRSSTSHPDSHLTSPSIAAYSLVSRKVKLSVRGHDILFQPKNLTGLFDRTYVFDSEAMGGKLFWKPDGFFTTCYVLVDGSGTLIARIRNSKFSRGEVGAYEIMGNQDDALIDEIVISGLAHLTMVQSTMLGSLIMLGGA